MIDRIRGRTGDRERGRVFPADAESIVGQDGVAGSGQRQELAGAGMRIGQCRGEVGDMRADPRRVGCVGIVHHRVMLMGAIALTVFALGYSLPLAAGLVGISFGIGRLESVSQRLMPVIRIGGGILLVGVGFYLLATI